METKNLNLNKLIGNALCRENELSCYYKIDEMLRDYDSDLKVVFKKLLHLIPEGFHFPELCSVKIEYDQQTFASPNFSPDDYALTVDFSDEPHFTGRLTVSCGQAPSADLESPFQSEERELLNTLKLRLSSYLKNRNLREQVKRHEQKLFPAVGKTNNQWMTLIEFSRKTDQDLYVQILCKLLNLLCRKGIKQAKEVFQKIVSDGSQIHDRIDGANISGYYDFKKSCQIVLKSDAIIELAKQHIDENRLLENVQKWIMDDRLGFLSKTLVDQYSSISEIADALRRYTHFQSVGIEPSEPVKNFAKVTLIRRMVSDQLPYIKTAKKFVEIEDFYHLTKNMIYPAKSYGLIGGKGAGLFLVNQILKSMRDKYPALSDVRIPKTRYVTADGLHSFMHHNGIEDISEQKYKDFDQISQEHQHIIRLFKDSSFSREIIQSVAAAIDDFGNKPLIVRSSSLLEDRIGRAFMSKYKSVFVSNTGDKNQKLNNLLLAMAEVYSSAFGPEPIRFRMENDLIDFQEEIGVIIQEVVGFQLNGYYAPFFSGFAFGDVEPSIISGDESERWMVKIVPGLCPRNSDRLFDKYAVYITPAEPEPEMHIVCDDNFALGCSQIQVFDRKAGRIILPNLNEWYKECGKRLQDRLIEKSGKELDSTNASSTDESLFRELSCNIKAAIRRTNFIPQIKTLLGIIQDSIGESVNIEFASDGRRLYILQCMPRVFIKN